MTLRDLRIAVSSIDEKYDDWPILDGTINMIQLELDMEEKCIFTHFEDEICEDEDDSSYLFDEEEPEDYVGNLDEPGEGDHNWEVVDDSDDDL